MSNVGYATLQVIPSMRGAQAALQNAFNGVDVVGAQAGDKSGKSFVDRLGGVVSKGVLAVGVAAGATLTGALVKGWNRLTAIEDATAKLTGLGNSAADVKAIMDNALASVKGTAFGLDEAATVAAGAVAAGIKPGQQLQGVLSTIADTATIAGASMADTGAIFDSVAARGKLQGDDLMQLQSRGVPVLAFLAKHYGITAQAASDMVSAGKVDFASFDAAMQENLAGAALKSGQTTSGAFKNMGAALSRFGAALLSPVFPLAKQLFNDVTTVLDNVTAAVTPLADALTGPLQAGFTAVESGAKSSVAAVSATFGKASAVVVGYWTTFTDAAKGGGEGLLAQEPTFAGFLARFGTGLGLLGKDASAAWMSIRTSASQALAPLASELAPTFDSIKASVGQMFSGLFAGSGDGFIGAIAAMLNKATPLITSVIDRIAPVIAQILPLIGNVFAQLIPVVQNLVGQIGPLIEQLLPVIMQVAGIWKGVFLQAFQALAPVIPTIVGALGGLITALVNGLAPILSQLAPIIATLVTAFQGTLVAAISALVPVIPPLINVITQVVQLLAGAFISVLSAIAPIIPPLVTAIAQIAQVLVGALGQAIQAIIPVLLPVITMLITFWQNALTPLLPILPLLANLLATIVSALAPLIPVVVQVVALLIQLFYAAISPLMPVIVILVNLFAMLIEAIVPIIQVLVAVIGAVIAFTATVIGAIVGFVTTVVGSFTGLMTSVTSIFGAIFAVIRGVWNSIFGFVSGIVSSIAATISGVFSRVGSTIAGVFSGISNTVGSVFSGAVSAVKGAVNGVIGILNSGINFINSKLIDTANKVPFVNIPHIPQIPRLAEGGIVPATPGGVLAFIGEGGEDEMVLPKSKAKSILGAGGSQPAQQPIINVYPRQEIDIPALARQVARELAWGTS